MDVLQQLLGRLHPLVVHLPIGFIMMGLLLQWYDRKQGQYAQIIAFVYLWAGITATLACITGYLQYMGEGYSFETVERHLWSGIATAVFSFLMYGKLKAAFLSKVPMALSSFFVLALISFTGHQGGNITHGEDYLVEPLPNSIKSALGYDTFEEKQISLTEGNWQSALLYEDVIMPILNNKCVSCHNPKKNKGDLLLHSQEGILKGGESGQVVIAHDASKSEIFSRMTLPMDDDDHMPPEGKTQPTKEEIQLIEAWIAAGHPFEGTVGEIGLKKELFIPFFPKKHDTDHPDIEITAASQDSIKAIKETGIYVDPISATTNFLSVSCINQPNFVDTDLGLLLPIKNQISRLDLGGTQVTDAIVEQLRSLPNLTVLKLDHTKITGKNIGALKDLRHLRTINLTGSDFQADIQVFSDFKNLKKVFLYKTKTNFNGVRSLKGGEISIDFGNYELPPIPSDSIVY
ncbi:c-type cytochrome domain-containing protein [Pseudozobellia thermophila]|uniref:Leucine rich repeat-containing protein n=1 Tax=Pseudozobellia thermophila TaxID=192903 RepID=A0A1M6NG75_9FLAO|nr:c-type cytochrome domain-containing protein [Pseudozobellia thermophila]SHJ94761.1 Leucine rich repeat-containing protein [Pseudozobellia thermophila]